MARCTGIRTRPESHSSAEVFYACTEQAEAGHRLCPKCLRRPRRIAMLHALLGPTWERRQASLVHTVEEQVPTSVGAHDGPTSTAPWVRYVDPGSHGVPAVHAAPAGVQMHPLGGSRPSTGEFGQRFGPPPGPAPFDPAAVARSGGYALPTLEGPPTKTGSPKPAPAAPASVAPRPSRRRLLKQWEGTVVADVYGTGDDG